MDAGTLGTPGQKSRILGGHPGFFVACRAPAILEKEKKKRIWVRQVHCRNIWWWRARGRGVHAVRVKRDTERLQERECVRAVAWANAHTRKLGIPSVSCMEETRGPRSHGRNAEGMGRRSRS